MGVACDMDLLLEFMFDQGMRSCFPKIMDNSIEKKQLGCSPDIVVEDDSVQSQD